MRQIFDRLRESFNLLNKLILPVAVLTYFESWSPVIAFHLPQALANILAWPEFIGMFLLKATLTAFTYGYLIEHATGQEFPPLVKSFNINKKAFFKTAVCLTLLPYLLHFAVYLLLNTPTPFHTVQMLVQPLVAILWVKIVLEHKYPSETAARQKMTTGTTWGVVIITSLIFYSVYSFYYFIPEEWVALNAMGIFLLKYSSFWIFLSAATTIIQQLNLPKTVSWPKERTIILINPVSGSLIYSLSSFAFREKRPYVFNILRGLTPDGYEFKEFTRIPWKEEHYTPAGIVGITCFSNNCMEAYRIAKGFRKRGSKVIMGGSHVTAFPEEALEFCDTVVVGPVEGVWEDLIRDYESGNLKRTYAGKPTPEAYNKVTRFLLTQPPELITSSIETTRGCKFNCNFCGAGHLRIGYYNHPLDLVIELVKKASTYEKTLNFLDDNIYSDPAYAKELFKRLIPLKIHWNANSSIDIAKDPEALQLCKDSGCVQLLIGYEIFAGSKEVARIPKLSMAHDYISLTQKLKKMGIQIKGQFLYGFDSDDFMTFWKLVWSSAKIRPLMSTLTLFTPIPNSRLYGDIEKQDRFINLNWNRIDFLTLTYDHPKLNNPFFRNCFIVVNFFFFLSTSTTGLIFLMLMLSYFYFGLI